MNLQPSGADAHQQDGFVLLRKVGSKSSKAGPTVKISRTGRITFNEAAFETMGKPERVEFYFHPAKDQVAIAAVVESTEHSYRVRHPAPLRWTVTAKSLVRELRLNPKVAQSVDATLEKGLLIANLADIRNAQEAEKPPV